MARQSESCVRQSGAAAAFFLFFTSESQHEQNKEEKQRGGEQREGRLPRQFTVTANYTQLIRCRSLANLKVEADL